MGRCGAVDTSHVCRKYLPPWACIHSGVDGAWRGYSGERGTSGGSRKVGGRAAGRGRIGWLADTECTVCVPHVLVQNQGRWIGGASGVCLDSTAYGARACGGRRGGDVLDGPAIVSTRRAMAELGWLDFGPLWILCRFEAEERGGGNLPSTQRPVMGPSQRAGAAGATRDSQKPVGGWGRGKRAATVQ